MIDQMRDLDINAVRLPVCPGTLLGSTPGIIGPVQRGSSVIPRRRRDGHGDRFRHTGAAGPGTRTGLVRVASGFWKRHGHCLPFHLEQREGNVVRLAEDEASSPRDVERMDGGA